MTCNHCSMSGEGLLGVPMRSMVMACESCNDRARKAFAEKFQASLYKGREISNNEADKSRQQNKEMKK